MSFSQKLIKNILIVAVVFAVIGVIAQKLGIL